MALHILCGCSNAGVIPPEVLKNVRNALVAAGLDTIETADLCHLAADQDPRLREWASGEIVVAACHPRAVRWLFAAGGAPLDEKRTRIVDLRGTTAEEALRQLGLQPADGDTTTDGPPPPDAPQPEWQPWFPVIDYDRCTHCRQCFNFCLFGVYEMLPDNTVAVRNPSNCKNNCPACARICPQVAIMFPKLDEEPLNGGEIEDEQLARANIQVNLEKILGDNIYDALQKRREKAKARRLLRRKEDRERAEREREACRRDNGGEGMSDVTPGKEDS